jgi:hypothetical protein
MKKRLSVFMFALLGIMSSGRLADSQPRLHSSGGPETSDKAVPPIDAAVPVRLSTATVALG